MLYHERECKNEENANFVQSVYLLAKLCNIFDEAFFIDVSILALLQYSLYFISLPYILILITPLFALKYFI